MTAGIPIESIARMMGHTNIDSTQVYAQVTDRKISSDMDRLMERRKRTDAAGKETARLKKDAAGIVNAIPAAILKLEYDIIPMQGDSSPPAASRCPTACTGSSHQAGYRESVLGPVILQASAADFQRPGKLPVSQEPFPVEGRTVVTGKMFHFFLHIVQQGKEPAGCARSPYR